MTDWLDDAALKRLEAAITEYLRTFAAENPTVKAIDRGEPGDPEPRWFVRLQGEAKDFTTVWLTLGQRTLRYETYVMPAPPKRATEVYDYVLRRNNSLIGGHFSIGVEDAIFLRGELPVALINADEIDRLLGTVYATVERHFPALVGLAFQ